MKRRRTRRGVRPWKGKLQAYIEVRGKTYSKTFELSATEKEIADWRQLQKDTYSVQKAIRGSFADDVQTYLERIAALRSAKQFVSWLQPWLDALGNDRPRRTITADEIDQTMQRWQLAGVTLPVLRKRRMCLMALWNRLDGKHATNPVRGTRPLPPAKPEARGLPYTTITRILSVLQESQTKRRLAVIAYTGLPPSLLMLVTRADLDLKAGTVRVQPRRKGKGVEARTLPLIPDGVAAFKAFDRANAYGTFSGIAANRVFQNACRKVDVHGVHLYDLRHSFGAALYLATRDLATVSRFLLHSTPLLTARYAQSANVVIDRHAAQELGRSLSKKPVPRKKAPKQNKLRRAS